MTPLDSFAICLTIGGLVAAGLYARSFHSPAAATASVVQTASDQPTEWEHGLKTSRVIATRYSAPRLGQSIGFQFPLNENDCDRAELSDFMEAHNGWVYQGGGYPGAEMFVKFKDATDKDGATQKMRAILPDLTRLITDLGSGKKVHIDKPKPEYEWPNVAPPPAGEGGDYYGRVGTENAQYKVVEVTPGKWQWTVDQEAMQAIADTMAHRRTLWQALQTRVLTDQEMLEALRLGDSLNIELNASYNADSKKRELDRAFRMQDVLRSMAAKAPAL